ncbi:heavy-metal-associated domain-containing protein [Streptomyces massasporeus]|uniref:heavy-metal-associated domain-containing protein n=1 Tax=Streptomyces TaxID=1883 RepID=UPI0016188762|nr:MULTISPECIES: heavy-metal-associated domain-containing protein [unclassified Streptomyces]MBB6420069.1 copper chaperone CopZ [Streptomyces sp. AK010]MBX9360297.1 heavy-metal-associated domain-containing protein [Streptomyces sp. WAC04114]
MAEKTYTVSGMNCGHCAASITEEVRDVPGVTKVDVDVPAGRVTVHAEAVDDDAVRAAITEAGYEVTAAAQGAAV